VNDVAENFLSFPAFASETALSIRNVVFKTTCMLIRSPKLKFERKIKLTQCRGMKSVSASRSVMRSVRMALCRGSSSGDSGTVPVRSSFVCDRPRHDAGKARAPQQRRVFQPLISGTKIMTDRVSDDSWQPAEWCRCGVVQTFENATLYGQSMSLF